MKRSVILLNLVLVALTAAVGWKLREQYLADQNRAAKVRAVIVKPAPPPPVGVLAKPDPFTGATYAEVAQKNLFSKDRNPNIIVEPPPPVVVKPMPALPLVYGVMGLPSGMTAMMAEKHDAKIRGVHAGDTVGEFKVLAVTSENISFEWDGKKLSRKIDDLLDRGTADAQSAVAAAPAGAVLGVYNGPPVKADPTKGITIGTNTKACQPGDNTPAGTVVDGYRNVRENTPFGPVCRWISGN